MDRLAATLWWRTRDFTMIQAGVYYAVWWCHGNHMAFMRTRKVHNYVKSIYSNKLLFSVIIACGACSRNVNVRDQTAFTANIRTCIHNKINSTATLPFRIGQIFITVQILSNLSAQARWISLRLWKTAPWFPLSANHDLCAGNSTCKWKLFARIWKNPKYVKGPLQVYNIVIRHKPIKIL